MASLFPNLRKNKNFATRSFERDAATDFSRLISIFDAIERSMSDIEAEKAGLQARLDTILPLAVAVTGNGDDEYLSRETVDTNYLDLLDAEIKNGEQRIEMLAADAARLLFLRKMLLSSFPEFVRKRGAH